MDAHELSDSERRLVKEKLGEFGKVTLQGQIEDFSFRPRSKGEPVAEYNEKKDRAFLTCRVHARAHVAKRVIAERRRLVLDIIKRRPKDHAKRPRPHKG